MVAYMLWLAYCHESSSKFCFLLIELYPLKCMIDLLCISWNLLQQQTSLTMNAMYYCILLSFQFILLIYWSLLHRCITNKHMWVDGQWTRTVVIHLAWSNRRDKSLLHAKIDWFFILDFCLSCEYPYLIVLRISSLVPSTSQWHGFPY